MSVTPPGDHSCVSTQLRLVDPPEPATRPRAAVRGSGRAATRSGRARAVRTARGRRVHWTSDWHLDAATKQVGREGVAAARAALALAHRSADDPDGPQTGLSKAS